MYLYIIKWFTARLAFFLAILLVLQPFLHAHIDDGYAIHGNGFHFVNEHEEVFSTENSSSILLSNTPHASHIISVDLCVQEGIDALLFSGPIFTALLISLFVLALQLNHRLKYAFLLTPKKSLKQRLPASRAPPTF
ncbi:MAG: hypothetical protein ACJZ16_06930 [Methylophilaceae bacterium]